MDKLPRKSKQWAKEAYDSLDVAWGLVQEQYPNPTDEQKLLLIEFATPVAAARRGINDKSKIIKATDFAFDNLKIDFDNRDKSEAVQFSICFLLAYLDSHVSFGLLTESKAQDIMHFLMDNYEINDGEKVEGSKPFIFH